MFSPNDLWVVVANEAEPSPDFEFDPENFISIIRALHRPR